MTDTELAISKQIIGKTVKEAIGAGLLLAFRIYYLQSRTVVFTHEFLHDERRHTPTVTCAVCMGYVALNPSDVVVQDLGEARDLERRAKYRTGFDCPSCGHSRPSFSGVTYIVEKDF